MVDEEDGGTSTSREHQRVDCLSGDSNQSVAREVREPSQEADPSEELEKLPDLPPEMIVDILSRLPVKSLLLFKCVCRSWEALISARQFIKMHFHMLAKNPTLAHHKLILRSNLPKLCLKYYSVSSVYNEPHTDALELEFPLENKGSFSMVVGSCHGLICVVLERWRVMMFNPFLRVSKTLSVLGYIGAVPRYTVYGFGFDELSDDYKVVMILCNPHEQFARTQVFVNTVRQNSWRMIQGFPVGFPVKDSGVYANGTLNWISLRENGSLTVNSITSLNLENELYHEIQLPDCGVVDVKSLSLGTLGGCLCIQCYHRDYSTSQADIWLMNESWNKLVTIPNPLGWRYLYPTPICISSNGEILMDEGSCLVLYNSRNNKFRFIEVHGIEPYHDAKAELYVESLVSPITENV